MCIRDSFQTEGHVIIDAGGDQLVVRVLEDHARGAADVPDPVSYTHLRAHETVLDLVCRLLLEKKKKTNRE